MPFHEYRCRRCGEETLRLVRNPAEEPTRCEACRSTRIVRLLSACHVRTAAPSDPGALRRPGEWRDHPERFGHAMRALGERTRVPLSEKAIDAAVERLQQAKESR
jgi:putative FmdB family regulatory protein